MKNAIYVALVLTTAAAATASWAGGARVVSVEITELRVDCAHTASDAGGRFVELVEERTSSLATPLQRLCLRTGGRRCVVPSPGVVRTVVRALRKGALKAFATMARRLV